MTATRLTLLAGALLAAPVTLIVERASHHRVHAYVLGFGGAVLASLVLLRLAGLVRAVERARRAERVARREAEQAQQLLTYQNKQLVELDHLKDEFVSSVSHELRTPLTSISGYVELMLENEPDEEKRDHLAIVDRNAQRLLGLVSDLLFTARLQDGRLELEHERVDLGEVVAQTVASARPRATSAQVTLTAEVEPVAPIDGESVRLAQLLDNLVSNAIKFTPQAGASSSACHSATTSSVSRCRTRESASPRRSGSGSSSGSSARSRRSSGRFRGRASASTSRRRSSSRTAAGSVFAAVTQGERPSTSSFLPPHERRPARSSSAPTTTRTSCPSSRCGFERAGYEVVQAHDGEEALELARARRPPSRSST